MSSKESFFKASFVLQAGTLSRLRELCATYKCAQGEMITRALLAYNEPIPVIPDVEPAPITGFPVSDLLLNIMQQRREFNARMEQSK